MARIWVVGSGASGVHFALTLLQRGFEVTMIDVGREGPDPVLPELPLNALKETLEDPVAYFLGRRFDGVLLPDVEAEYYGIPPGKAHVLDPLPGVDCSARGFSPLFSFARGGLAEAWTGGSYPLNDQDLGAFPISYADLEPHYDEVAGRIGISGLEDDLAPFLPVHGQLLDPLELDAHSTKLLEAYRQHRGQLNDKLGCYLGRTRIATLSRELGGRKACSYLGRCLWGCPVEALYTPSLTLRQCLAHPKFTYLPGLYVSHFRVGDSGRVTTLVARPVGTGEERVFPVDRLALAAGTLFSAAIFLRSVRQEAGQPIELRGLMDNRQVLVPFLNPSMLGEPFSAESYQYHQLGMAFDAPDPLRQMHCQITTLKTALMHPIVQRLPFDLKTSMFLGRSVHAALGVVNVNFPDSRRENNAVALDEGRPGQPSRLAIRYTPAKSESARLRNGLRRVRRALRRLGCFVPPGMSHVRPMGASVHYAGTLPMSSSAAPWTTTEDCQSREFENLFLVDGSTFPFLPAKNITFTLMANATRVARNAF